MILFLDFDGVLHPLEGPDLFSHVPRFERVMRCFPAVDIVISSAWREAHPLEAIRRFFSPDIGRRIIGVTPILGGAPPYGSLLAIREAEIESWLRANRREGEAWIALDDTPILFRSGCPNLIEVAPDRALDGLIEAVLRTRLGAWAGAPDGFTGSSQAMLAEHARPPYDGAAR